MNAMRAPSSSDDGLFYIPDLLLSDAGLDLALHNLAQEVSRSTAFPIVTVHLYDEARRRLLYKTQWGVPHAATQIYEFSMDAAPYNAVIREGIPRIQQGTPLTDEGDVLGWLEVQTRAVVPIKAGQRVIGALTLGHPDAVVIDDELFQRVDGLASLIAALVERKRAEKTLYEAERFLQAALDSMTAHVSILDGTGTIIAVNAAWSQFASGNGATDPQSYIGVNYLALCDGATGEWSDEAGLVAHGIRSVIKDQVGEFSLQYPCHSPTEQRWFTLRATRFEWAGAVRVIIAHQNITDLKLLEQDRVEKERLRVALEKERELREVRSRFVSVLSHELRTPLSAVMLATDMLMKFGDRASADERAEYLDTIKSQIEHLTELINDILRVSKTEFTGIESNPETVSMEVLCREVVREVQIATRTGHDIVFVSKQRPIHALVDQKLMYHAISNLLTNAIKYSPEGGEIRLELLRRRGQVIIRVSDEGIGIPADDVPRLFEPFQRASNTAGIHGTGLGLFIVKQAVDLHGGTIAVESAPGAGTAFTITLPSGY